MKSEFQFLNNLKHNFNLDKVGDDCAVLSMNSKSDLVITSDLLIEDIDFLRTWMIPEFLGHKALAVSLSDIAAMGAKPGWAMLSIGIPEDVWKTDFIDEFYDGWFRLAKKFDVELVGGDVSKTPDKIMIDSIVGGEVSKGKAILRSGAKPGDSIYVTGNLGGAKAGLNLLENGLRFNIHKMHNANSILALRQMKPTPRLEIGRVLSDESLATSMIDLSDGLSGDLFHICESSKVGAKIFSENIPIDENIREFSSDNLDILEFALNGGEDFELLFTANSTFSKNIFEEISIAANVKLSHIGEITETPEKIELVSQNSIKTLNPKSFRHF